MLLTTIIGLTADDSSHVGVKCLSTEGAAVFTGEEDNGSGNLTWLSRTAQRSGSELLLVLTLHGRWDERCPDGSRGNSVDANAVSGLLIAQATGEGDDCALGGGVVEKVGTTDIGVDAGVVDDGAAALHVWQRVLGKVEVGVNVGVEGVEPLVFGKVLDVIDDHLVGGVVEEDVDLAAKGLDSLINQLLAVPPVAKIGRDQVALLTVGLDSPLGFLGILFLFGEIGDERVGSLHGKEDGGGAANTRVTSGDESLLALELASSTVLLALAVGGRNLIPQRLRVGHLGLLAREVLVGDRDLVAYSREDGCVRGCHVDDASSQCPWKKLTRLELSLVSHFGRCSGGWLDVFLVGFLGELFVRVEVIQLFGGYELRRRVSAEAFHSL